MKILLDYVFSVTAQAAIPQASSAFLKQVCLVVKPANDGVAGQIYECVDTAAVANYTDNLDAQYLFYAGMKKVFLLCSNDLDVETELANEARFFTVIASSDFREKYASLEHENMTFTAKASGTGGNSISIKIEDTKTGDLADVGVVGNDITISIDDGSTTIATIKAALDASSAAMALIKPLTFAGVDTYKPTAIAKTNLVNGAAADQTFKTGSFAGVSAISGVDSVFLASEAAKENRCAFYGSIENLCYAFGKLLSRNIWSNQQFIQMPVNDGINSLGQCESLFDDKISFALTDDEFGSRLALFVAGGKAIAAPYIVKAFKIELQSGAVTWINLNQPSYTISNATLLQKYLSDKVLGKYVPSMIESASIGVTLEQDNFVASAAITIKEPRALWRIFGDMIAE